MKQIKNKKISNEIMTDEEKRLKRINEEIAKKVEQLGNQDEELNEELNKSI